jgi:hypothetical protein
LKAFQTELHETPFNLVGDTIPDPEKELQSAIDKRNSDCSLNQELIFDDRLIRAAIQSAEQ